MVSTSFAPSIARIAATIASQCAESAASTVMSRSVRPPSSETRSTAPIVAAGLADRARDLAEHAGQVVDLDAEGQ